MDKKSTTANNQTPKRPVLWRRVLSKTRHIFEQIRSKNPHLFDGISNGIQVLWLLISTFWTAVSKSTVLVALGTCLTAVVLYLAQWVLLTNRREREVAEEKKSAKVKLDNLKQEFNINASAAKKRSMEMMSFAHMVTHEIKMNISRMPNQRIGVTRYEVVDFLVRTLNTLEKNLTDYYGQDICASIKLCNSPSSLKTFARGKKNTRCRGGVKKAQELSSKPIEIGDMTQY